MKNFFSQVKGMLIDRISLVGESFKKLDEVVRKTIDYRISKARAFPAEMWEIRLGGDTFFAKHILRRNGFQWNPEKRCWVHMVLSRDAAEEKLSSLRGDMGDYSFHPEYEAPEQFTEDRQENRKRFYDGIAQQENMTIGGDAVPIVKSLQEYVRYEKKYGQPTRYVLNDKFEDANNCGVIFVDQANQKLIAYSPPQEYFSLNLRA